MKKVILPLILLVVFMGWAQYSEAEPANKVMLKNINVISASDNPKVEFVFDGTAGEFDTSYHEDFVQVELTDTSVIPPKQWVNVKDGFFKNIFVYQFDEKTVRARLYTYGNAVRFQDKIRLSKEDDKIVLQYTISGKPSAAPEVKPVQEHVSESHSETLPLSSVLKGDAKEKHLIPNASGPPEIYGSFLKMIIVLGVLVSLLLIALYLVKRFFLKKTGKGGDDQNIRVITSAYVGPKKTIALVEVAGERIVVGITADNISMLTKVSKDMEFNEVLKEQISAIPDTSPDTFEDDPDEKQREKSDEKKVEINDELWEKA